MGKAIETITTGVSMYFINTEFKRKLKVKLATLQGRVGNGPAFLFVHFKRYPIIRWEIIFLKSAKDCRRMYER
jgi:hypothetical protein